MTPDQKRAILNMTPTQYGKLKKAADALGMTVPAYCKMAALERAKND